MRISKYKKLISRNYIKGYKIGIGFDFRKVDIDPVIHASIISSVRKAIPKVEKLVRNFDHNTFESLDDQISIINNELEYNQIGSEELQKLGIAVYELYAGITSIFDQKVGQLRDRTYDEISKDEALEIERSLRLLLTILRSIDFKNVR